MCCFTLKYGKPACTQVKCTWLLPTTVKQVDYARARDINVSSADKIDLDKSINGVNSSSTTPQTDQADQQPHIKKPNDDEIKQFHKSLSECKIKPVFLGLVDPYAESFITSTRNIPAITNLFDKKYMELPYPDLLKECYKVELNLSKEQIMAVEKETIDQAKGSAFFRRRAGRIGASKCYAACHNDPLQPSQSL